MKKVALAVAGVMLVGSSLLAQPFQGRGLNQNGYYGGGAGYGAGMGRGMGYGMHNRGMGMGYGMGMGGCGLGYYGNAGGGFGMYGGGFLPFANINLTPEQRYNISILRDEMRLEMRKTMKPKYFSNNKFDKNAYLKSSKENYEKGLEIRAKYIEKVYELLTKEQKEMLDADIMDF